MTRHTFARRRPLPRLLRAQVWRPRHVAPLCVVDLWLLVVTLRSAAPQTPMIDVALAAAAAGHRVTGVDLSYAAKRLQRRGLCLRHGNHHDRVSLTLAGRAVAQVEAAHLLAPAVRRPAAAPAVEVWRCAPRAPGRQTTTSAQESIR